jgi:hypothetical protein
VFDELLRAPASSLQGVVITSSGTATLLRASEPIRAVGRVTGNVYEFSSASPEMDVDARDAAELLKAPDFALAGADSWQNNKIIASVARRASAERNV